ncbi:MAG TPA: regulatory protein RecX [Candidatus Eisenbacteria bacterium]|nr:regulatory protein RecX [Candidatus Eisenbacteria bacterium]
MKTLDEEAVRGAQEIALRALERTRRTRRELERRLADRDVDPDAAREALARLERVGLIDDLEYARAFLREKLGRRAVGARLLRGQLVARGVAGAMADQAMEELATADDGGASGRTEFDRARRAALQFVRRYARLDPRTRRQRLSAALVRRGFDYDTVSEALRSLETEGSPPEEA